jgi:hypothetical protein
MNTSKPYWYDQLSDGPVTQQRFTSAEMIQVEKKVFDSPRPSAMNRMRLLMIPLLASAVIVAIFVLRSIEYPEHDIPLATPGVQTSLTYNPLQVKTGDKVGKMTIESTKPGTFGKDSVAVLFKGNELLEGTYEVATELHPYNPGEVIFTPMPQSAAKLPRPDTMADAPIRFRLAFSDSTDKAKFGSPGTTGKCMFVLTQYMSVSAPILEGTPNSGTVQDVTVGGQTPPPALGSDELSALLKPYSSIRSAGSQNISLDRALLGEWIQNANKHFQLPLNEKTINSNQREQIRTWLNAVFTAPAAEELVNRFLTPSGNAFLITGGSAGLVPYGPVNSVKDQSLTTNDASQKELTFTMTFVKSGTQDAYLTCTLKEEKGDLKLDSWKIDYR